MALIIEGDMPTKCCLGGCPIYESCSKYDSLADTRPSDCLIIGEIPDKHGRFIDVDAYIKTEMDDYRKHHDEYSQEKAEVISDVLAVLDKHTPVVLEASK